VLGQFRFVFTGVVWPSSLASTLNIFNSVMNLDILSTKNVVCAFPMLFPQRLQVSVLTCLALLVLVASMSGLSKLLGRCRGTWKAEEKRSENVGQCYSLN